MIQVRFCRTDFESCGHRAHMQARASCQHAIGPLSAATGGSLALSGPRPSCRAYLPFTFSRLCTQQAKNQASSFGMLVLVGVAAAFGAKPGSVASKLAQASHPLAVSPQWLPVFLAAETHVPPTNHRRLSVTTFTDFAALRSAAELYNANPTSAEALHGPIGDWNVAAVDVMDKLFKDLSSFNADISNWDTSSVTSMVGMFQARALCAQSPPRALLCMPL